MSERCSCPVCTLPHDPLLGAFHRQSARGQQLVSSLQPLSGVCPVRRHIVHIAGSRVGSQTIVGELHSPKYN
jgi:hypothetical protein